MNETKHREGKLAFYVIVIVGILNLSLAFK